MALFRTPCHRLAHIVCIIFMLMALVVRRVAKGSVGEKLANYVGIWELVMCGKEMSIGVVGLMHEAS